MPDEDRYAPSVFMSDYVIPDAETQVNEVLPRGAEGGLVETIKRAVVASLREAITSTGLDVTSTAPDAPPAGNNVICIDLEYPMKQVHYPGIWVQFSATSLKRAGVDQEAWVQEESGEWCPVQEWEVRGRVTLTAVALKNKDRDRLADTIISALAFSRPPNVVITKPEDAQQNRALVTALMNNPHIAMTLNTDVLYPGGQQVNIGVPWQTPGQSDTLAYEDSYAFDILGQFNVKFRHDGVYELSRVDMAPELVDELEDRHAFRPWSGPPMYRTL